MIRIQIRTAMMGAMAFIVLAAISHTARADDPVQLQSIDVQTLSGQQVQLKLHLSGPAPEPLPFTIDKPARIAFDLPNTTLALASRRFDVRSAGVDTVGAVKGMPGFPGWKETAEGADPSGGRGVQERVGHEPAP